MTKNTPLGSGRQGQALPCTDGGGPLPIFKIAKIPLKSFICNFKFEEGLMIFIIIDILDKVQVSNIRFD